MVVIGALIGGMTNYLAIKMLFRPYNVIKIGSWRLPFTPGLIPKRRGELAIQLGNMVVDYLLTAEGLAKKLKSSSFLEGMNNWMQKEVKKILQSKKSAADLIETHMGIKEPKKFLLSQTKSFIKKGYQTFVDSHRNESLLQMMPMSVQKKIESLIPTAATYILERGQFFLQSKEGKERLSLMIESFLAEKGTLGNMVSMFLGQERLVDKIHPELLKFLRDEGTKQLAEKLLRDEWNKVKQKKVADLLGYVKEEEVVAVIVRVVDNQIPLYQRIEQPLEEWTTPYEEKIIQEFVPKGIDLLLEALVIHLDRLLERFHLNEIVTEQVQAFSIERIEELALSVANRELKMITYLGAFLGGIIGFIQSFIVMMTG
ncbi:DUF445 domain-containing protein [bacterium LRH843]|nr:DUF445 domain-containing protein [bacterium LRH843]